MTDYSEEFKKKFPGPWSEEPDRLEWEYKGVPCLIRRNMDVGTLCGYAAVTRGHPWFGKKIIELTEVKVHGGLTYVYGGCEDIGHNSGKAEYDWWLGFDCAHAFDLMPTMVAIRAEVNGSSDGETYKGIPYVKAEVRRLAKQIIAAGN